MHKLSRSGDTFNRWEALPLTFGKCCWRYVPSAAITAQAASLRPMLPRRLLPQVGATEHGGIEHRRLLPMIVAADLLKRIQDPVLPLPLPLPVPVQPAPLSPTISCACASLPDSPELSPLPEGTYDAWSINAFQRCQMAADARSSCSASVLPHPKDLVDTEQSYKCKFSTAAVAETTEGKPLARERSEDRLYVVAGCFPSNVICADPLHLSGNHLL